MLEYLDINNAVIRVHKFYELTFRTKILNQILWSIYIDFKLLLENSMLLSIGCTI